MTTFVLAATADVVLHIISEYPNNIMRYSDAVISIVEEDEAEAALFALRYGEWIVQQTPRNLTEEYQLFIFTACAALS